MRLPHSLLFALVAVPLAAGCTAAPPSEPASTPRIIANDPDGFVVSTGTVTTFTNAAVRATLAAPPEATMRALLAAYEQLGIEVTLIDPPGRRIGNPGFSARGTLNRRALSDYLSCGETLSGVRANTHRVSISLVSTVRPQETSSLVDTRLQASVVDRATGNNTDVQPCHTTGLLEKSLHDAAGIVLVAR